MSIKEKITQLLESKFDRIFIIHVLGVQSAEKQWQWVKPLYEAAGIFDCKNLEMVYDVRTPFDMTMYKKHFISVIEDKKLPINTCLGRVKASISHHKIYKKSLALGYQRILILEDDICLLKDLNNLYFMLANMPDDGDLISFNYLGFGFSDVKTNSNFKGSSIFQLRNNINTNFSSYIHLKENSKSYQFSLLGFYSINHNAMQYYINLVDSFYKTPYLPLFNTNDPNNKFTYAPFITCDSLVYEIIGMRKDIVYNLYNKGPVSYYNVINSITDNKPNIYLSVFEGGVQLSQILNDLKDGVWDEGYQNYVTYYNIPELTYI